MPRVTQAQRIRALERKVKTIVGKIRLMEEEQIPEKIDAIGFHYEPHEEAEYEYEDEPY